MAESSGKSFRWTRLRWLGLLRGQKTAEQYNTAACGTAEFFHDVGTPFVEHRQAQALV
jgi:hypothetical protein